MAAKRKTWKRRAEWINERKEARIEGERELGQLYR
jgi:hypothetical protein